MMEATPSAAPVGQPGVTLSEERTAEATGPRVRFVDRALFVLMVSVLHAASLLPDFILYSLGALGGWIGYLADRRHRRIGHKNLRIAFPERTAAARRAILRASYVNLGRSAAEYIRLAGFFHRRLLRRVSYDRYDYWRELCARYPGRGLIVLSAHFGNFELLAPAHAMFGHQISLVHHTQRFVAGDMLATSVRERAGVTILRKHSAARAVLRALKAGDVVGVPFDQNAKRREAIFLKFFNEIAATPSGPARVAMISGALVVPVFIVRQPGGRSHMIEIHDALAISRTGDLESDVADNSRRFLAAIEEAVKRHPEQFLWTHRRYRTRPRGMAPVYD